MAEAIRSRQLLHLGFGGARGRLGEMMVKDLGKLDSKLSRSAVQVGVVQRPQAVEQGDGRVVHGVEAGRYRGQREAKGLDIAFDVLVRDP